MQRQLAQPSDVPLSLQQEMSSSSSNLAGLPLNTTTLASAASMAAVPGSVDVVQQLQHFQQQQQHSMLAASSSNSAAPLLQQLSQQQAVQEQQPQQPAHLTRDPIRELVDQMVSLSFQVSMPSIPTYFIFLLYQVT